MVGLFGDDDKDKEDKDKEDEDKEDKDKEDKEDKDKEDKKKRGVDASGNPVDWQNSASWVSFVKSLFVYFLLTMIFGLFGSNFIYLTTRGSELDSILPTNELFYSAFKYKTQKKGASNVVDCHETSTGTFSVLENNFPYNLITVKGKPTKEQLKEMSFIEKLTNWFAKCVAGCFKSNRGFLKWWLDSFSPDGPLGNHVFQMYFAAPFTVIMGGIYSLFTGWFSACGAAISADLKITILGGFFLYSWVLFGGLAGLIFLRLMGTLLFYPMSQNWKEVANIMACNVKPLVILFGFFVCGSAYDTLDPTIAGIMGIVYLILVVHTVWKYFSNKLS
jgi:hypothetical protein